jgi:hypothetical protein
VPAGRRRQPVDVGLDRRRADVPERAGADVADGQPGDVGRGHRPGEVETAESRGEEAGEVLAVPASHPGVGGRTLAEPFGLLFFKSRHPVPDVAGEQAPLGDLAVVDDVDTGRDLLPDDLRDRARQRRGEGVLFRRARVEKPLEFRRPGQRAGV